MKICYLVLAHNNPQHLQRLVNVISSANSDVFIHIDAKSSISEFTGLESNNVFFTNKRFPVFWGSFSIVEATLSLLAMALQADHKYDYYCLLSGSDYPLRSYQYIESYFKKNYGSEFMNIIEMPSEVVSKPLSRLENFYVSPESIKSLLFIKPVAYRISSYINNLKLQRNYKAVLRDMKPYAGSQWWALSQAAVQYIIDFVHSNPKFVRFFRNTSVPDEMFFQTILGNSEFKGNITHSLTFTDWSRGNGAHPAIIDGEHINYLNNADNLIVDDSYGKGEVIFARKFPNHSEKLVGLIQQQIW